MRAAAIHDDGTGMPVLEIHEDDGLIRVIAMKAVATYSELWGIEDPVETLEAILADQDRPKGPGEASPFGDAYTLLAHRERAREQAAAQVRAQRTDKLAPADPRSPELAGALAAYRAVHIPVAPGEECAMDRCRRQVRERSGIPFEPTKTCGASSRSRNTTVREQCAPELVPVGPPTRDQWEQTRRSQFAQLLGQVTWMVDGDRRGFLHGLTGNTENPLQDVPLPAADTPDESAESLLSKYGADHAA